MSNIVVLNMYIYMSYIVVNQIQIPDQIPYQMPLTNCGEIIIDSNIYIYVFIYKYWDI